MTRRLGGGQEHIEVLSLLQLGAFLQGAAGDVPAVYADDCNRPLLLCVSAVLLANTPPEIAEPTPAAEKPMRETMLFDIRWRW